MSHSDASASVPPAPPLAPVDGRRWGRLFLLAVLVMGALALQAWVAPRWGSTARIHEPWPERTRDIGWLWLPGGGGECR
jgi:hypothetical protein